MRFTVRPYRAGDAAAMAALFFDAVRTIGARAYSARQLAAWAPEPPSTAAVQARAGDGRTTLVAVNAAQEVIGYGDLEPHGHLDHLYCRPDVVGRGVGGALIEALLAVARSAGLERVYVEASEVARPAFERRGFKLVERRDFVLRGVPIHNFLMAWSRPPGDAALDALERTSFGRDDEVDALLGLILAGRKTATCWAARHGTLSHVGKRVVACDSRGRPRAVLETTSLQRRRYCDVDQDFAAAEGEGDGSLAHWRDAHRRFFEAEGDFSEEMELWCERFRVVAIL